MANMTPMQIMDAIRDALEKDERPQKVLAKAAGLHEVNLSQFKSGKRELPLKSLVKLANVVGLVITVSPKRNRRV